MDSEEPVVIEPQTIRELQLLDASLSDIETEIKAKKHLMAAPVLAQRQQTINKIPSFWAIVFDNASSELDAAMTASDSEVFAKSLVALEVTRPEIPASAKASDSGLDNFGEPRSVTIKFAFKENECFSDAVLEKTLYYRHGKDGSVGLVSDPVKINWKPGKDLTEGMSDAVYAFWTAQKQNPNQKLDAVLNGEARKARDKLTKEMPEFKALASLVQTRFTEKIKERRPMSFFNFFSYRGRWVSPAEHAEAMAELKAKRAAALAGKDVDDDDEDDEDDDDDFVEEAVETFPLGHEVAVTIAEDIWPDAIDYFLADSIDSDDEDDDDDDDDDDDEDEDVDMS